MTHPDGRVWTDVLAHLRKHHPAICRQWFDEVQPLGIAAGMMRLRASSNVHRDYLQRECMAQFKDAVQTVTGWLVGVRFLGPDEDANELPPSGHSGAAPEPQPARFLDSLVINPDNTFEHFVIGPGNRLAHAAAVAVAEKPGQTYNPLFVHGGVGLGKSHLLQSICLRIREQSPETLIYYISCDGFMNQFHEAVQAGEMADFRNRFRHVDILVIDDIHFLGRKERSQEEFHHTFNSLHQDNKQIVLSSDAAPEAIPHLEQRVVSRFKQGLVAEIQAPDFETRVAILKTKAALRGIALPDDVLSHIAACVDTNIRELEGAITSIQLQASVEKRPPDLAMARAAVGDLPTRIPTEPTIQIVISAVTEFYGVRLTDLQSKRRHRSVTMPRQVCMYLARAHTRHSLEEIGGHFGGRDHTTVMHSIKAIEQRRTTDKDFDAQIRGLDERLRKAHA